MNACEHPPDVTLLLRAHSEQRWLSREVIPVVRQLETGERLPEEQLPAAHAYLEVVWVEAVGLAREADAALRRLDALDAVTPAAAEPKLAATTPPCGALRAAVARRVVVLVAAPVDYAAGLGRLDAADCARLIGRSASRCARLLGQQRLQPVGERLQGELLGDVERQPQACVAHELHRLRAAARGSVPRRRAPARCGGRARTPARPRPPPRTTGRAATAEPGAERGRARRPARGARRGAGHRRLRARGVCAPWRAAARARPPRAPPAPRRRSSRRRGRPAAAPATGARRCRRSTAPRTNASTRARSRLPHSPASRPARRASPSPRRAQAASVASAIAASTGGSPPAPTGAPRRAPPRGVPATSPPRSRRRCLDARGRQRVEAHLLAARGDRGQQLARGGGQQDEVRERSGLLERLQQAVGGLVVERVRVLQHEHPPARLERRAGRRGDHGLVDVAHQHFPRAGGRDPRQIRVRPARRAPAHLLGSGRPRGEQRRGEGACDGALADAGGAVEEVGVSRPPPAAACPPAEASSPSRNLSAGSQHRAGVRMVVQAGQAHAVNPDMEPIRPAMPAGTLITIEGLDGAGKTTLAQALAREIAARVAGGAGGRRVELLREPGGVRLSERIRELVKDPGPHGGRARGGAAVRRGARAAGAGAPASPARRGRAGAARSLRGLLARLPGRGPGAGGRADPRDQPLRHRGPGAGPHAAAVRLAAIRARSAGRAGGRSGQVGVGGGGVLRADRRRLQRPCARGAASDHRCSMPSCRPIEC